MEQLGFVNWYDFDFTRKTHQISHGLAADPGNISRWMTTA
jgi:hypothetical protein